ncbi:hypothetical protein N7468_003628 [Penicillium chermesinum]|uniref:Uncharacterized protein n=1 Tax=Penicillium chermesinum TaxID=63820 RepID=A0A9W9P737_9EURO|nr:uncharacterized protein N7468_003628 [Penicillium chermesinum]KAJ5239009.1 hypothetical protein N7468_003628 [Penicillium chermesinum]KAJ6164653.1 hypothetical protein N7470_003325 [Penicillium chermesinum]
MKFSIAILPIIAALGMASVMDEKSTAKSAASSLIDAASPKAEVCCNTTPCFVGCPSTAPSRFAAKPMSR